MRFDLATKYDLNVPRYTSYPTAPHFSPAIGPSDYGRWLAGFRHGTRLSLYLHIPYCARKCWFCACHAAVASDPALVDDYLDCLWREIDMTADLLPGRMPVSHLHFGGGSPTILSPSGFLETMDRLRRRFDVIPGAEFAVELDPRTTSRDFVAAMARAGATRASIGVQDFDLRVQTAINRVQPYETTASVIGWLRDAGIGAINIDLVYGLPHQRVEPLMATADLAAGLRPSRIALFGYAHVPWMKPHQKMIPEESLPDTSERWRQYEAVTRRLVEQHGYLHLGLDHFAMPGDSLATAWREGRLSRNFQGYTTDDAPALLGLGASGIGFLPQGYVANETGVEDYKRLIREGRLATRRGVELDDDDRLRRVLIERLMCDMTLDVGAVCGAFGVDAARFDADLERLRPLEEDGLLTRRGRVLSMTEAGRPLVRAACAVFDRYLNMGGARHSKAV